MALRNLGLAACIASVAGRTTQHKSGLALLQEVDASKCNQLTCVQDATHEWVTKCSWGACVGCVECNTPPAPAPPQPPRFPRCDGNCCDETMCRGTGNSAQKPWEVKCGWKWACGDCAECSHSPPSPPPHFPDSAERCESSTCYGPETRTSQQSWETKCGWRNACSGCAECAYSPPPPPPNAPNHGEDYCDPECESSPKEWETKCGWTNKCSGCVQCQGNYQNSSSWNGAPLPPPSPPPSTGGLQAPGKTGNAAK